ncbi:uncharacterized protein LOC131629961 [Vicia villosa]|uniref:uncharacterized protein LOC131629961 n=1 Tax=Vicia villosa TaxID=3911 RepID=UPI00273C4AD6|nr:uncharacterized protein LOC131629961 [Vicia villosa]
MDIKKAYDSVDWLALKQILAEIGFPRKFIGWIMKAVTTVTYQFNINGHRTRNLQAAKGLRQGDPISLGDAKSVQQLMGKFNNFSKATGLTVNPAKCRAFFGGMTNDEQKGIEDVTGFSRGKLPFRYLGIPLTSKKLSYQHCLELSEKIGGRMRHWSSHLLSYAGRLQLIQSTLFGVANYWTQCIPLPKCVIKNVGSLCRTFFWTSKGEKTRKSLVSWSNVCTTQQKGGLNIVKLEAWNKACMVRLLWNLCKKEDSVWVKWIHTYYFKEESVMDTPTKDSFSWIMKEILQVRDQVKMLDCWKSLGQRNDCKIKEFYLHFLAQSNDVDWKGLLMGNYARPRAKMMLWLACHGRLATKDRLVKFGMIKEKHL